MQSSGLGHNNFGGRVDLDGTRAVVDAALEAGVTLLDTADIYGNRGGSEEFLGEVLQGRRDGSCSRRSSAATCGTARRLAARAIHPQGGRRAPCDGCAPTTSTSTSTTRLTTSRRSRRRSVALDELVQAGKVRYVGHSNLEAAQVEEADKLARERGRRVRSARRTSTRCCGARRRTSCCQCASASGSACCHISRSRADC